MGAGVQCIKYLLFIFNLFIALCGLGLVVIGCLFIFGLTDDVVQWIDINTVAEILQNELLESAVYLVIGAGGLVFLIAVCGCLGAILSSKCLLGLYFVFLMIIFAAQLAAGILAAIYGGEAKEYLEGEGLEFLQNGFDDSDSATGVNKTISEAWNEFQSTFECCGVAASTDYPNPPGVPDSCCKPDDNGEIIPCMVYTDGCVEIFDALIQEYETILAAAAVGVACFELFCMLFAICLCRNIGDDDD